MAEKRRAKKRKDEYTGPGGSEQDIEKASKEEYKVAKWLKSNVPTKKTKFLNHNVEYFSAIKAVDALLASKFAQGDNCIFPHRQAVIDFMGDMLFHKFFHRARKVPVSEQELRGKGGKKAAEKVVESGKEGGKVASTKDERATDAESSHAEGSKVEKVTAEVAEKRKRKIRLEMHPEQVFIDGHEAYVWLYDPIPMHYWIFGALLVVGAIVICLFPLWPPLLRKGVYYLSIAAAGFLVFILGLVVLRCIVFCLIWVASGGKHHFWLLPNLTEDVGFFASFWPLYNHEYKDGPAGNDKGKKLKKRTKRDKNSGDEEEPTGSSIPPTIDEVKERESDADRVSKKAPEAAEGVRRRGAKETPQPAAPPVPTPTPAPPVVTIEDAILEEKNTGTPSESDSESSQRSSTGKDFEMVEPDEVDTS